MLSKSSALSFFLIITFTMQYVEGTWSKGWVRLLVLMFKSRLLQLEMAKPFLDALASLGSMLESGWVTNVFEILSNIGHIFRVCSE